MLATKFVLGTINQRLLDPQTLDRVKVKLLARARAESLPTNSKSSLPSLKARLCDIGRQIDNAERNLGYAESEEEFRAVSKVRNELSAEKKQLVSKIATLEAESSPDRSLLAKVESAMGFLNRLPDLAADARNLVAASELFQRVNARLYGRFQGVCKKKRTVNRLVGGVITVGNTAPPIPLYNGKTDRRSALAVVEAATGTVPDAYSAPDRGQTDEESESLGNVNRGERI